MKNIKQFSEISFKIKESLNTPIKVDWIKTDMDWIGSFNTDKNKYVINITFVDFDVWKFKYFLENEGRLSIKMTKFDYDVFKVISTIYKSIFEFIDEINPNGLIFGADNDSKTRVKFYSKFSNECVEKYNYKLYESSFGNDKVNPTLYVLYHELDKKELFAIIKSVTEDEFGIQ